MVKTKQNWLSRFITAIMNFIDRWIFGLGEDTK